MILDNKIAAVGGLWAVGMMGAFASQYSSKSAPSVKVIHSRLYAQALTISALVASAGVEYYDRQFRLPEPVDTASYEYRHMKDNNPNGH
eukprot:CAMPEP_0114235750 /NCGR_PEP_ID=MMETSP0058-20121206/6425_1 /TAXON_ID=36894 /ORGANISM="Pyramimonas parkeae, CCMP726" /LENGTH=88 /DNA_ID=CAMNT_0001347549 /DNA_START=354 /DNA_END=620 /DNA_ORIENTATION=+